LDYKYKLCAGFVDKNMFQHSSGNKIALAHKAAIDEMGFQLKSLGITCASWGLWQQIPGMLLGTQAVDRTMRYPVPALSTE